MKTFLLWLFFKLRTQWCLGGIIWDKNDSISPTNSSVLLTRPSPGPQTPQAQIKDIKGSLPYADIGTRKRKYFKSFLDNDSKLTFPAAGTTRHDVIFCTSMEAFQWHRHVPRPVQFFLAAGLCATMHKYPKMRQAKPVRTLHFWLTGHQIPAGDQAMVC